MCVTARLPGEPGEGPGWGRSPGSGCSARGPSAPSTGGSWPSCPGGPGARPLEEAGTVGVSRAPLCTHRCSRSRTPAAPQPGAAAGKPAAPPGVQAEEAGRRRAARRWGIACSARARLALRRPRSRRARAAREGRGRAGPGRPCSWKGVLRRDLRGGRDSRAAGSGAAQWGRWRLTGSGARRALPWGFLISKRRRWSPGRGEAASLSGPLASRLGKCPRVRPPEGAAGRAPGAASRPGTPRGEDASFHALQPAGCCSRRPAVSAEAVAPLVR